MINNPCKWYGNGGSFKDQKSFTYEGGNKLFHFSPGEEIDEHMFSHWTPINLIFLANDIEHAKDIISRMLQLRLDTIKEHVNYNGYKDFTKSNTILALPELLLSKKDKWIIEEAPTNQFYKVSWASNDTIL